MPRLLRGIFILLLLASGLGKAADMAGFYAVVGSYQALPDALIPPSAWLLMLTELVLATWLIGAHHLRWAALTLIGLHLIYLGWTLLALWRGLALDNCGCFGVYFPRPLTWQTPLEDAALLALAFSLWYTAHHE
jgi:Methylamine utilisation protein MauE